MGQATAGLTEKLGKSDFAVPEGRFNLQKKREWL